MNTPADIAAWQARQIEAVRRLIAARASEQDAIRAHHAEEVRTGLDSVPRGTP